MCGNSTLLPACQCAVVALISAVTTCCSAVSTKFNSLGPVVEIEILKCLCGFHVMKFDIQNGRVDRDGRFYQPEFGDL